MPETSPAPSSHDLDMAIFHDLLELAEAPPAGSGGTFTAINDGAWSDPDTWAGGRIPDRANAFVTVEAGVEVTYDVVSDIPLAMLRVDGALTFATDQDTRLTVDTFAINEGASLTIGTEARAIDADVTVDIVFRDSRFIDRVDNTGGDIDNDPTQLSLGLVSHGAVSIFGAEKTAHLKAAIDPGRGDTTITLAEAPEGWRVGDTILVTGTYYERPPANVDPLNVAGTYATQDEEFTIVAINGDRITLSGPLQFEHDTPDPAFKASIANLTRNVEFRSADPSQLETRGHTMFMHTNAVEIHNAAFTDLGRTDKSRDVDDYVLQGDGTGEDFREKDPGRDPWLKTDPADVENMRGRYALHLHKTGTEPGEAVVRLEGNVVSHTPGWGIVQHDSAAVLSQNIAYANFGAGFVAETGNETGSWVFNLSILTGGRPPLPGEEGEGDIVLEKDQGRNQDFGVTGTGFWFQGRILSAIENVAVSSAGAGFFYLHRGVDDIESTTGNLERPEIGYGEDTISNNRPPIEVFIGNETYASRVGLIIVGDEAPRLYNDDRTLLEDFAAWEFGYQGIHIQYSAHYTISNLTLYGAREETRDLSIGVKIGTSTEDVIVHNALISNVPIGIYTRDNFTDSTQIAFYGRVDQNKVDRIEDFGHRYIEVRFQGVEDGYDGRGPSAGSVFVPKPKKILGDEDLENRPLTLRLDDPSLITGRDTMGGVALDGAWLTGTKTDTLGIVDFPVFSEKIYISEATIDNLLVEFGYFTVGARRVLLLDTLYSDRITAETDILTHTLELDAGWTLPPGARYLGALPDVVSATYFTLIFRGNAPVQRVISENDVYFAGGLRDAAKPNVTMLRGTGIADTFAGTAAPDLVLGNGGADTLAGGGGTDTMIGGDGSDSLTGAAGNDRLHGNDGFDTVDGGDGNDTISGDGGNDTLRGGRGNDALEGGDGNDSLLGDDSATIGGTDSLTGGDGDDTLDGAAGNDTLRGEAGGDSLLGGNGNDLTESGGGADRAAGGAGNDTLLGGDGDDTLDGGAGDDSLDGGAGEADVVSFASATAGVVASLATDAATGGAGTDTLRGFQIMEGSGFNDDLTGDAANNTLRGGAGDDVLEGGNGNDLHDGGDGFDVARYAGAAAAVVVFLANQGSQIATRAAGNDTLIAIEGLEGSRFNDTLTGNADANLLVGGNGDDRLQAFFGGADTVDGGAGTDIADFGERTTALRFVQRADGTGSFGAGGVLRGVETVWGTATADTFTSDAGGHGFDGGSGDDTVFGGGGTDILLGGDGLDTLSFEGATGAVTAGLNTRTATIGGIGGTATVSTFEVVVGSGFRDSLSGDINANTLRGGAGDDTLFGGAGDDLLEGGDGADLLIGAADGRDTLDGGAGTDIASFANATAGVTVTIQGGAQAIGGGRTVVLIGIEALDGSGKDDRLTGDGNANRLTGGGGADALVGGAGNDTLAGGLGADTLTGGSGGDVFVFAPGDGTDRIVDFGVGDRLLFEGFGTAFNSAAEVLATARLVNGDLQLRLDNPSDSGTTTVNLAGVSLLGLVAGDFLFG